ncbi:MAG: hypothetical protein ACK4ND_13905 [Cytophagaceae bacterium]
MRNNSCLLLLFIVFVSISCSKKDDLNTTSNEDPRDQLETYLTFSFTGDSSGEDSTNAQSSLSGAASAGFIFIVASKHDAPNSSPDFSLFF